MAAVRDMSTDELAAALASNTQRVFPQLVHQTTSNDDDSATNAVIENTTVENDNTTSNDDATGDSDDKRNKENADVTPVAMGDSD